MLFRQLFDPDSSTYTYLLADPSTGEAVLIDPVFEQVERDVALLGELSLRLVYTLETHVHADHVTGASVLRDRLGSRTVLHADSGATCADVLVHDGDVVQVGALAFEVLATPGHTDGDVSYRLGDRVFTGDTLLIGGCGRTDFQEGDAGRLYDSVHGKLFPLPPDTLVYPAHDYNGNRVSTIGQEMAKNARLGGGRDRASFVALMGALNLPHPKKIDVAVPANRACGRIPQAAGPVVRDLSPEEALARLSTLKIVDVRGTEEFHGELGHIPGASCVPLDRLEAESGNLPRDTTILLVCRSGRRSAAAWELLSRQGFTRIHNLSGGMIAWTELHLPASTGCR